ncbi:hypothetical protein [Novosphingobium arvoryzae]|uniref:Uncharacterized protein n=1 Tax=Novosphingobium arvoryzae TaxID=1256514 RepID=A0A918VF36_9SPHN|nr:hypothetical protein [Novosphingobium arvoryzae]GGZ94153.1 hypothetical protein GCM10011617_12790 [Novosphingobium arvoryzae]
MLQNDTEHSYYHDQSTAKYQLRFFGHFAEKFSQPNFELGHFQAMPVVLNGPRKPLFILSDVANDFVTYCIVEKLVDLRIDADAELNIGKSLFGNNPIANASPYELVVLLTYMLGNETHWQSRFINSFQSGLLQSILERGAELSKPEKLAA